MLTYVFVLRSSSSYFRLVTNFLIKQNCLVHSILFIQTIASIVCTIDLEPKFYRTFFCFDLNLLVFDEI